MELLNWLTATTPGKCVFTMLVSMIPIIELRGGLPFGVALGLPYYLAFPAAVIGNIIPTPFIIVYIRKIFMLMRKYMPRLNGLVDKLERKAHLKGKKVLKYQSIGLWLFVAIPLPGTGEAAPLPFRSVLQLPDKGVQLHADPGALDAVVAGALGLPE